MNKPALICNKRRLNPRHAILKLLLAAEGSAISTRSFVAACGLLGITGNSARVALVRLSAAGLVASAGRGAYELGPAATGLAADVARWRSGEARVRPWTGAWIAVHSGALGRTDRAALRVRERALELLGLRELERGLHVRPDNLAGGVEGTRARLQGLGLEPAAAVFSVPEFDAGRDTRARRLWDAAALERGYRMTQRRLDAWLARRDRLASDDAARQAYLLGDAAIRQLVFDPLLPEPLIDVGARAAFTETVLRFDDAGHAIWRRLTGIGQPAAAGDTIAAQAAGTVRAGRAGRRRGAESHSLSGNARQT